MMSAVGLMVFFILLMVGVEMWVNRYVNGPVRAPVRVERSAKRSKFKVIKGDKQF